MSLRIAGALAAAWLALAPAQAQQLPATTLFGNPGASQLPGRSVAIGTPLKFFTNTLSLNEDIGASGILGSDKVRTISGAFAKATATGNQNLMLLSNNAIAANPLAMSLQVLGNATGSLRVGEIQVSEYGTATYRTLSLQPSGGNLTVGLPSGTASEALLQVMGSGMFVRPGYVQTDGSSWASRFVGMAGNLLYSDAGGPAYFLILQNQVLPSASAVPYEVASLVIQGRQLDPSNIGVIDRDYAAADLRGMVGAGNMTGRAWGIITFGGVEVGADGFSVSHENAAVNYGVSQPSVNTALAKYNTNYTSTGSNPITAAILFSTNGPGWHKGMWMAPASLSDHSTGRFIELDGKWSVTKAGFTDIAGAGLTSQPLGVQAESGGGLAVGLRGRASDGVSCIQWLSNNTLTTYAQLCSDSTPELVTATAFVPSTDGTISFGKSTNALLGVYTRNVILNGSTSGALTVKAPAIAGANTLTLPAGTTDFSATGGASQVVRQSSAGAALTVGRLACSDLSDSGTVCGVGITALTGDVTATGPGSVTATIATAAVTYAKFQNLAALSVAGRSANSSGVGADISATAASDAVLRESGSAIGFGTIATGGIANNAVTLAKLATQAANTVLANVTSGTAAPTAHAMTSCSTAASAVSYTTNTGFGCNTSVTAATLSAVLSMSLGGLNANLTASNGGIFYSTASAGAILAGTATARQMLQSGASTTPAWSTTTWPATTTINRLLYSSAANVISDLATANSSILVTDSGGIPSLSTTLPAHTLGGSISGGGQTITNLASLALRDTSAAFDVTMVATSSTTLTAARTLTLDMGNVAHTLKFGTSVSTVTFPTGTVTLVETGVATLSSLASIGTVTTGTWNATVIAGLYGGTGLSTAAVGDIIYASATTPTWSRLADVATGSVLVSGGVNTAPAWSAAITITTSITTAALSGTTSTTTPLVIGGSAAGSSVEIRATSGTGTSEFTKFTGGTNGGTEWARFVNGGNFAIGNTTAATRLEVKMSSNGGTPASSGTAQANGSLRLRGGFAGVLDFGNNGGTNQWIQSTDATDLSQIYALALNPNGGAVAVNGAGALTSGDALAVTGQITGSGKVYFTGLSADTASADRTVCQDTTSKEIKTGTGTLGICLGTSSARFKVGLRPITDGLAEVIQLRPKNYFYKPGHGDDGVREQYGFTAEDLIDVLPRLTHLDSEGRPLSVDLVGMIPVIVRSIQELKAANDNLLDQLKRSVAR